MMNPHCDRARFALCSLLLMTLGCGQSRPEGDVSERPGPAGKPPVAAVDGPAVPIERKIIYTSQIDIVVDDMDAAQRRLQGLLTSIQESGGYLARQELSGSKGYRRESSWTIRVPLAKFDGFVAEIETIGELQRHIREAQDVTDAYADLDARLRNKQSSEKRLLTHLERTGELKDTLEVERELSRVRGEVEQLQGQLNVLKNKTDLATVVLTLHERISYTPATAPGFATEISRTFDTSCQCVIAVGKGGLLAIVALAPWLVVGGIVLLPIMIRRWRKRVA